MLLRENPIRSPSSKLTPIRNRNIAAVKRKLLNTKVKSQPRRFQRRFGESRGAAAVEDYVRESVDRTFASIREQDPEIVEEKDKVMKRKVDDGEEEEEEEEEGFGREKSIVVEEESKDWPLDAGVGWGIRASEYFENHPVRNVVGDNGVEIDWEGEVEDNWVKEINCLEWESFAFHPSPLLVLVFERYNRASENWKALKELEKAVKVCWNAKDRLPPRSVKIDINIERDLDFVCTRKQDLVQRERDSDCGRTGSDDRTFLLQCKEALLD